MNVTKKKIRLIALAAGLILSTGSGRAAEPRDCVPEAYAHAVVNPLSWNEARITGGYLGSYIERTSAVSIPDFIAKMEQAGGFENFRIVAKSDQKPPTGRSNHNEFVYKLMEAGGYFSADPTLNAAFQPLISDILAAQDKDGYLNTYYQNPLVLQKKADNRFQSGNRFEFYAFGHLAQAGLAWKRAAGDDQLLDASSRFADLICDRFGSAPLPYDSHPGVPNVKYEHPNHEMAMVELYRATGNRRYLDFVAHTLDDYGFWSFPEIWGHGVQETLLLAGGTDVYLELGKPEMLHQLEAMWRDATERKMYITGGVGSVPKGECYGAAYELPNATSYCETCAAISKIFWGWRMLLATGQSAYVDDMERTLYNATLTGIALSGTEYFYVNLMEKQDHQKSNQKTDGRRKPYFVTACCPPNLHRLFGSLPYYCFTTDREGVQVQLFANAELKTTLPSGTPIHLRETTDYPYGGKVQIELLADGDFTLSLRIPSWAETAQLSVNGQPAPAALSGPVVTLAREWKKGDTVALELPMQPRLVPGRTVVADEKGKLALMRGPLVYCLESPDNPGINLFDIQLAAGTAFREKPLELANGALSLAGTGWDKTQQKEVEVTAIPYHLWANREPSLMRIWIPAPTTPFSAKRLLKAGITTL